MHVRIKHVAVGVGLLSAVLLAAPILQAQEWLLPNGVIRTSPVRVVPDDHSRAATGEGIPAMAAPAEVAPETLGAGVELDSSGVVRGQALAPEAGLDRAAAGLLGP